MCSRVDSRNDQDVVAIRLQCIVGRPKKFTAVNTRGTRVTVTVVAYRILAEAQESSLVRRIFRAEDEETIARTARNLANMVLVVQLQGVKMLRSVGSEAQGWPAPHAAPFIRSVTANVGLVAGFDSRSDGILPVLWQRSPWRGG